MKENKFDELKANKEEYEKCQASPVYFYNNYVRKEGDPELSEEEYLHWKKRAEFIRDGFVFGHKRNPCPDKPLTPDVCFYGDLSTP